MNLIGCQKGRNLVSYREHEIYKIFHGAAKMDFWRYETRRILWTGDLSLKKKYFLWIKFISEDNFGEYFTHKISGDVKKILKLFSRVSLAWVKKCFFWHLDYSFFFRLVNRENGVGNVVAPAAWIKVLGKFQSKRKIGYFNRLYYLISNIKIESDGQLIILISW